MRVLGFNWTGSRACAKIVRAKPESTSFHPLKDLPPPPAAHSAKMALAQKSMSLSKAGVRSSASRRSTVVVKVGDCAVLVVPPSCVPVVLCQVDGWRGSWSCAVPVLCGGVLLSVLGVGGGLGVGCSELACSSKGAGPPTRPEPSAGALTQEQLQSDAPVHPRPCRLQQTTLQRPGSGFPTGATSRYPWIRASLAASLRSNQQQSAGGGVGCGAGCGCVWPPSWGVP